MEIRSYRRVFDLERRLYRVDRLRLNPGGVPVRGVVYLLAILAGELLLAALPLSGRALALVPWYVRDVLAPVLAAALLGGLRIEGRPFHLAAWSLARHACGASRITGVRWQAPAATRWRPAELLLLPDGSDARVRRMRYTGPGAALVSVAHARVDREATGGLRRWWRVPAVTVVESPCAPRPPHGQVIALARGASLLVRPCSDRAPGV